MPDSPVVLIHRTEGTIVVTINRPETRNAINAAVAAAIGHAMEELDGSDDLRVGILTGSGGYFCAGMDLKAFVAGESAWAERGFAGITQKPAAKPLIAAVEGFAVAGGLEIALACDLLVAARGAKLGIPEVKRSLIAAGGGLLRLPRVLPRNVAMELALTGDPITAERGFELGLVNRLADPGAALDTALELAGQITPNAPLALAGTKRILTESVDWPESEFWAKQRQIVGPVAGSEDAREGSIAFAEKRAPVWKGR
ncbi:MAG TPA: crotonase/enoyl-CoA hydratase family protein [Solirubrobacteraceae bacterium]|nr:crotonase/enoyl-CoA hydratase family protein [Solirubrobacteraceae bacterium]